MAYRFTSFAYVLLLSLSLVAKGKRHNRALLPTEPEPTQSTLHQDTDTQLLELQDVELNESEGTGISVEEQPKTLQSSQCAEAIREKSLQVIERIQAYFAPPCNVEAVMLGSSEEYELSEEGMKAICAPQCFNNVVLSTPLSGIQEILENCGGDPNFPMFESAYSMVSVMDEAEQLALHKTWMEAQRQARPYRWRCQKGAWSRR